MHQILVNKFGFSILNWILSSVFLTSHFEDTIHTYIYTQRFNYSETVANADR